MIEYTRICGCGGIGRLIGFRFQRASVQVRVLSSAPYRVFITDLTVTDTRFFFSFSGIAPSQSDARYPYGHTFSMKVNALSICQSNLDFLTRSYEKCQIGTLARVYQVPKLGTCPFSKYNHRHLLLHKYPGIRPQKCAWVSINFFRVSFPSI